MIIPKWAIELGKVFRHNVVKEDGVYRWARNTCFTDVGITVNWNLLSIHVQNKRVSIWDYIKVKMMSGDSLQHFSETLRSGGYEAERYFGNAYPDENVIEYLIRNRGMMLIPDSIKIPKE